MDPRHRAAILARRASFLSASLAAAGCGGARPEPDDPSHSTGTSERTPHEARSRGDASLDDGPSEDGAASPPEESASSPPADTARSDAGGSASMPETDPQESAGDPTDAARAPEPPMVRVCLSIRTMPRVRFAFGSVSPDPSEEAAMREAAAIIRSRPDLRVRLVGHRDAREPNRGLALARAEAVQRELVGRGVDPSRLCAVSRDDDRPLSHGRTPEARAKNRRVAFEVLEEGEPCE